ncbi:MAG: DUF2357 domain-containing protein [Verrucomicrobiota bacterium]
MADQLLDAIEIPVSGDITLLLWGEDALPPDDLQDGCRPVSKERSRPPILYNPDNHDLARQRLILFESTSYLWELKSPDACDFHLPVTSTLDKPGRKAEWKPEIRKDRPPRGRFSVVNYLGTAEIRVGDYEPIRFEVQSRKFDFHGEYEAMVGEIADECQQLLLEWDSPTSFNIETDPEREKQLLLEQFLFIRHVLGSDKLDLYLEEISRRPHNQLVSEEEWKPAALARSPRFYGNPLRYGRDWQKVESSGVFNIRGSSPSELLHERRYETFDTPPNRFIQFALGSFREICEEVISSFEGKGGTAFLEAVQMRDTLDIFLSQPFFADVGRLTRLPFESQTLQKREGYREILQAWLMLDAASRLDWPGREEAYDGTNRDAATLYEYWLYFVLRRILMNRLGMQDLRDEATAGETKPFIDTVSGGGLSINLRGGNTSISRFRWQSPSGEILGVHLFYNRTFNQTEDPTLSGSYSRRFRPDFTLVFFPARYLEIAKWVKAEEAAELAGNIGYLHFDSKYRVEQLEQLLGKDEESEISEEQAEAKATNTYKRGDLYKMHTYNDAIRRTAGSYVLYPGKDGEPRTDFARFEEIVPGVGAFRMRPGEKAARQKSEEALGKFLSDVLEHHGNTFSRNYRIRHWTHQTIRETEASYSAPPRKAPASGKPLADGLCLLGYVRPEQQKLVEEKRIFYLHAVGKGGTPKDLDRNIYTAQYFCGRNKDKTLPWIARIEDLKLVNAETIADLTERKLEEVGAEYYFLLKLDEPQKAPVVDITGLVSRRRGDAIMVPMAEIY